MIYNSYYYRRYGKHTIEELQSELARFKKLIRFSIPQFNEKIISRWRQSQIRALVYEIRRHEKSANHGN